MGVNRAAVLPGEVVLDTATARAALDALACQIVHLDRQTDPTRTDLKHRARFRAAADVIIERLVAHEVATLDELYARTDQEPDDA